MKLYLAIRLARQWASFAARRDSNIDYSDFLSSCLYVIGRLWEKYHKSVFVENYFPQHFRGAIADTKRFYYQNQRSTGMNRRPLSYEYGLDSSNENARFAVDDAKKVHRQIEARTMERWKETHQSPGHDILLMKALHKEVSALPARQRRCVEQVFYADRSLKEVGVELGVSESMVCHITTQAITTLRKNPRIASAVLEWKGSK